MALWSATVSAAEKVDYLRQVKPILCRRCYACHGALRQRSGLRLDTADSMQRGGDGGPAVEPGQSGESRLIDAVTGTNGLRRMPPEAEGEPLKPEEIAILKAWIDEGAVAPAGEVPQADPRRHWAFQRVARPAIPNAGNGAAAGHPIDALIDGALQQRHLVPVAGAPQQTLLRRVTLDLVGLPPTREELQAFLADDSPEAYEKVVDRLLQSPQYGERWGRHWMDIWRYSDWYGRRHVPDVWNSAP